MLDETTEKGMGKRMGQRLIITDLTRNQKEYIVCGFFEGNRMLEVTSQPKSEISETSAAFGDTKKQGGKSLLGNIYVGRVKDVVKSLNAAFIEIAPGVPCYYPLEELVNPVFVKKGKSPGLVQGDELCVQVERESMKTKPPKVTTNLNFTGKYLVLTTGNRSLGISKKLRQDTRSHLKELLEAVKPFQFGLVVRTNCRDARDEEILEELAHLKQEAQKILERARYQTCFSCMKYQEPEFIRVLRDAPSKDLEKIVTDDEVLYQRIHHFLEEHQPKDLEKLTLYKDEMLSLSKCYSLEVKLEEALKERVWLKSGGYLVIQPTEAMTVIDVNSGKSIGKKDVQKAYLNVNLEAAKEIAFQMRLRNLSGIILVDFIDLISREDQKHLMETLRQFTRNDPIPVQVVDITRLNLVEMTRKKVKKSLRDQFM